MERSGTLRPGFVNRGSFTAGSVTILYTANRHKNKQLVLFVLKETRLAEHGCDLPHLGDQLLREGADPLRERLHVDRLDDLVGGALLVRHPDALLTLHVDEVL